MSSRFSSVPVQDRAAGLRRRFDTGETVLGCFLSLGSALTAEIMGAAGYDCALIDLEHGAGDERDALYQMQALAACGCAALVRVESTERQRVHRVLDFGAHGVMFPRVDSVAQAEAAVAAMRYPPAGVRGVASSNRACAYGSNLRPYVEGCAKVLTIIQIESPAAVEQADMIAAVAGVDLLFLGPSDLSFAMGIFGEFDHPDFAGAVQRTAEAASRNGKHCGILLPAGHTVAAYHALGYRLIVSGADAVLLNQSARALVQSLEAQRAQLPVRE
ncbi:MAG: 2-dehydro-3-deoxyglucarate aldolase [Acidobacteria bacterium]|nr:2-dehydro-3-deoxyglucarate aldolase [Acidobacteriota bacterium]